VSGGGVWFDLVALMQYVLMILYCVVVVSGLISGFINAVWIYIKRKH